VGPHTGREHSTANQLCSPARPWWGQSRADVKVDVVESVLHSGATAIRIDPNTASRRRLDLHRAVERRLAIGRCRGDAPALDRPVLGRRLVLGTTPPVLESLEESACASAHMWPTSLPALAADAVATVAPVPPKLSSDCPASPRAPAASLTRSPSQPAMGAARWRIRSPPTSFGGRLGGLPGGADLVAAWRAASCTRERMPAATMRWLEKAFSSFASRGGSCNWYRAGLTTTGITVSYSG
jgi:hypothetical protein